MRNLFNAEIFKILTLRLYFCLTTGVYYLKVRNFNYSRTSECCFFEPINCPFVLHMGLFITN